MRLRRMHRQHLTGRCHELSHTNGAGLHKAVFDSSSLIVPMFNILLMLHWVPGAL